MKKQNTNLFCKSLGWYNFWLLNMNSAYWDVILIDRIPCWSKVIIKYLLDPVSVFRPCQTSMMESFVSWTIFKISSIIDIYACVPLIKLLLGYNFYNFSGRLTFFIRYIKDAPFCLEHSIIFCLDCHD